MEVRLIDNRNKAQTTQNVVSNLHAKTYKGFGNSLDCKEVLVLNARCRYPVDNEIVMQSPILSS